MSSSATSESLPSVRTSASEAWTGANFWNWVALVIALAGLAGSLFLSLGMGLKACPLCFYQRTFMMGLVAVLGMGLLTGNRGRLSLLALPLAVAGLGVAAFHVWLEISGTLECPQGLLGVGSAPQQSLVTFVLLSAFLVLGTFRNSSVGPFPWVALIGGVILGGLLAVASSISNPPMPNPPTERYPRKDPDICRQPFRP
jgi:disulfide bond formation protein DsbB